MTRKRSDRRGAAITEFAVCLPMLTLLVFGTIETSNRIFLRETLSVAAYECAREAIRNSTTIAAAKKRGQDILDSRNVKGSAIVFTPTDIVAATRGTQIKVEVTAPTSSNGTAFGSFVAQKTLKATVVMVKE
ncbi:MAG: TadE/TadG family type IV pilus assembly protein [Pirellulaceae bacterium]